MVIRCILSCERNLHRLLCFETFHSVMERPSGVRISEVEQLKQYFVRLIIHSEKQVVLFGIYN
jgi:hypothetical protein